MRCSKQIVVFFIFFLSLILFSGVLYADIVNSTSKSSLAQDSYYEADSIINEMQKNGFPTLPLIDKLSLSKEQFNQGLYDESYTTSESIKSKALDIKALYESINRISGELDILKSFGIQTTKFEFTLLSVKSDFESANIETSKGEADALERDISPFLINISKQKYKEIVTYRENLLINGINESYFENYYKNETRLYSERNYSGFLLSYNDFLKIKGIIEKKEAFEKNLKKLKAQNISFERGKGAIELFTLQVDKGDYSSAYATISTAENVSNIALRIKNQSKEIESEFERLKSLGIIDNKTEEMYYKAGQEYSLENFEESERLFLETKKSMQKIESENIILGGIRKAELKQNAKDFFIKNWPYMLFLILIFTLAYKPLKNYIRILVLGYTIESLETEKETISVLQKEMQKDYYIEHAIDKKSYHKEFQRFEERKNNIANTLSVKKEQKKACMNYFEKLKKNLGLNL